jgi:hypothetical protein
LNVLCQAVVRSTCQRLGGLDRGLLALVRDLAAQTTFGQQVASLVRVVTGAEVHSDVLGQRAEIVKPF